MKNTRKQGKAGEDQAVEFLLKKGYKIRERNWQAGRLELDIIAEKDNKIIFIEVKSRSDSSFEQPYEAVTKKKQAFIIKAAGHYIETYNIELEAQFDIISIITKDKKPAIDHIEDAFYPLV